MNKIKSIINLIFSKSYFIITVTDKSGSVEIKLRGLSDSFFMATVLAEAYDKFLDTVVEQSTEAGEAAAAQDLLKAINKLENSRGGK